MVIEAKENLMHRAQCAKINQIRTNGKKQVRLIFEKEMHTMETECKELYTTSLFDLII